MVLMPQKPSLYLINKVGIFCESGGSEKSRLVGCLESSEMRSLTAESVEGTSLPLESIDNVHGRHGPSLGVLCVGDCVTDHVLQEYLENSAGLLVDEARDTLDSTTASQTTDSGLGDALDVVTKDLPVTLGASLSETFASFAATRHDECFFR